MVLRYTEPDLDHYRGARDATMRAYAARPQQAQMVMELISRLRTFNEAEAMLDYIGSLPPLANMTIPVLLSISAQMSYLNEQERALPYLEEAYRGDPDFPPTLLARAQVLIYLGRFEEANADLPRCPRRRSEGQ